MTKLRVLLVEDDPDNQEMLQMCLAGNGFEVIATATCAEARAALAKQAVELVVMDMILPDGHGEELALDLRQTTSAPIIALSGRAVVASELFAGTIIKPVYPSQLLAKIRAALSKAV